MIKYSICNLYSGSKGNATLIKINNKNILIDAGKSARSLCLALKNAGTEPEEIDAIFITHEHTDHVSALQTFSHKYNAPIHILLSSAKKKFYGLCDEKMFDKMVFHKSAGDTVVIDGINITSFETPHDSAASVGYIISYEENGEQVKIGYATDIGHITDKIKTSLTGCESVVIESNHDENMLMTGPYPYELKMRIHSKNGHLSNSDCAAFCAYLAENGAKNIMLAHLSEENNLPEIAYNECLMSVADESINICVASPKDPVWLVK